MEEDEMDVEDVKLVDDFSQVLCSVMGVFQVLLDAVVDDVEDGPWVGVVFRRDD